MAKHKMSVRGCAIKLWSKEGFQLYERKIILQQAYEHMQYGIDMELRHHKTLKKQNTKETYMSDLRANCF